MYDQIDALKGIAIFLVVLGHSIIVTPIDLHENAICEFLFSWIYSVHMPLFFAISGFCFSYKESYGNYLWKKTKRSLIPYVVFGLIDCVPRYLFSHLVNRPRSISASIHEMLFYGGRYWFLYVLFIIFVVFPFVHKLIKGKPVAQLSALFFVLIMHFVLPSINIFCFGSVVEYLFYFLIGYMIKEHYGHKIWHIKLNRSLLCVVAVLLSVVWLLLIAFYPSDFETVSALIGIFVSYLVVQFSLPVRWFKGFGKYSLQIYLLNGFLLVISRTIIVSVLKVTDPTTIILFNMLVDFFLSYLFIKYICAKIRPVRALMGIN